MSSFRNHHNLNSTFHYGIVFVKSEVLTTVSIRMWSHGIWVSLDTCLCFGNNGQQLHGRRMTLNMYVTPPSKCWYSEMSI